MTVQMALWALSYPVVAIATGPGGVNGFELTFLRALGAALLLSPLLIRDALRNTLPLPAECCKIIGWGSLYFGAALTCFNLSIDIGRPELSGVVFAGFPIILAAMAAWLKVEPWESRALPWVLLSLVGAVIVVTNGDWRRLTVLTDDLRATLLMLTAMVLIARFALGAKRLLVSHPPLQFVALAVWGGVIALGLLALILGQDLPQAVRQLEPMAGLAVLYLILINTILTEWMSMTSLRKLAVLIIGVFNYLQPPLIVLFSLLLPDSRSAIGWPLIIGGCCILCGAAVVGTMQPGRASDPHRS